MAKKEQNLLTITITVNCPQDMPEDLTELVFAQIEDDVNSSIKCNAFLDELRNMDGVTSVEMEIDG